ncbi:MAG: S-layer homology domain-containing protein, partial [Clostridia bacterium]|nr:S-layer homology domain-containing protein [Clostridia bacterium]
GITAGVDPTHFAPDRTICRAEAVAFLYAAKGTAVEDACPFSDVAETDWFCNAVRWAFAKGITAGVDETHFGPAERCTRAQLVTMLYGL